MFCSDGVQQEDEVAAAHAHKANSRWSGHAVNTRSARAPGKIRGYSDYQLRSWRWGLLSITIVDAGETATDA